MSESLSSGKIAVMLMENAIETFESQQQLINLVNYDEPSASEMQDSGNYIWRKVQQQAPTQTGWDMTGNETGIISQQCPYVLGTPNNDVVNQRIDDVRNDTYWKERGKEAGRKLASDLNSDIASAMAVQGTMFYRSNVTSGYEFITQANAIMNERQYSMTERNFLINDRDMLTFGADLAARQTLQGQPADTWKNGMIGRNIANFNVYEASYLPNITGAADPAVTVTGNQAFVPVGGTVTAATGVVTPVDWREASLVVNDSSLMAVGDKFSLQNSGTDIYSVGLDTKASTAQAMTYSCIELTDQTHIKIYPKPIAVGQAAITDEQEAYANINTQILNAATITRLNTDASKRTNLFFDKSAVTVLGGSAPWNLMKELAGKKVETQKLSNGLTLYMVYDGDILAADITFRLFIWYGVTVNNPSQVGVAVTY